MTVMVELLLAGVAGVAGFVDAIAGGGGLLTVPALLLAGLPPQLALGTNKGQSVFGSGMSLTRYYHSALLDRKRILPAFCAGLLGALAGVTCVTRLPQGVLTPLVMVLLGAVAVFMIFYRPPQSHVERAKPGHPVLGVVGIALAIGFYDGFFGPGTGTFLILAFVLYFHDRLDQASANAKVVNFASNVGALTLFAAYGLVQWGVALPMGAGQAVGGFLGAHVTVRRGQGLVRLAIIVISLALLGKLCWQMFW